MARDDSVLYTGASSAAYKSQREETKIIKAVNRKKLLPAAGLIEDEFKKSIDELKIIDYINVRGLVGLGGHALEIEMLANEKAIEKIKEVKGRINNILRDNKGEADE